MKRSEWSNCIAYFFILLFLYTGLSKLAEIHLFKEQLTSSPLLGSMASVIMWALPIGEFLLCIALFIPALRLKGLYASLILMVLFTIYVTVILFMDDHLSCSCGGIVEELSPRQHVVFNFACVTLSGIAILILRKRRPTLQVNWLIRGVTIALFMIVGWVIFTAFSAPSIRKTGMEGRLLPAFDLLLPDSVTHFNTTDIPTGKPIIIIGFSPTCTHCGAETEDIVNHITQFNNFRIYFVTSYPFNEMKGFYHYFKLNRYPNITMGQDSSNYFMNYFKAQEIPFTTIFDSKKRLIQAFGNQIDPTTLLKLVAE